MVRWIAAAGAFVVSLDSMVNIAFPAMAAAFHVPPARVRWVIVCYVFTYAVTSFVGGAVADRVGHAHVFRAGLALSVVAFVVAGAAPAFGWLLAGRMLQGFAGGLVYGTVPGLVTLAAAPSQRNRALGFLNAAIGLAFSVGPVLGGILLDGFGWRAVFHVRVPLGVAALGWAAFGLPVTRRPPAHRLVRARDLVRGRVLSASALSFMANAGIFSIWLLAPFYLISGRGLDAIPAGVLFMLTPLGTALAAPVAARAADRLGPRIPVAVGLALEAAGLLLMTSASATTPLPVIAVGLFTAGFGLGFFQVPNMADVMGAFPPAQQGVAGGLTFLARTLGIVAGVMTLAQVFAARQAAIGLHGAFAESFAMATVAVALAAGFAIARARARGHAA